MGLWDKMREPVFLKESSDAQEQIQMLTGLAPYLTLEGQEILRQDVRFLEYGMQGERQIAYELKNSHMPMYILHDIYLEDGNLSAQIDYIVVTRKLCFIIECKNLYGNIEITPSGEFYRMMNFGGQRKMESIYSPITQNEHHLELLKKIRLDEKKNFLFRKMAEKQFDRCYQSVVVLANPKTMLYAQNGAPQVREKVIRADQLVSHIRRQYQASTEAELSDKKLKEWAESFLELHRERHKNYLHKYQPFFMEKGNHSAASGQRNVQAGQGNMHAWQGNVQVGQGNMQVGQGNMHAGQGNMQAGTGNMCAGQRNLQAVRKNVQSIQKAAEPKEGYRIEDTPVFKALRVYRWNKSQEEGIKPYLIYNDNQLKDLIAKMPENKRELLQVSGFGEVKVKKYGADILEILRQFRNG